MSNKISKLILFIWIYTILFVFFVGTLKYTLPFMLAGLFAFLLRTPSRFLIRRFKFKPWLATFVSTSFFFFMVTVLILTLVTILISELMSITTILQKFISNNYLHYINNFSLFLENISNSLIFINPYVSDTIISTINSSINNFVHIIINNSSSLITSLISFFTYIPYITMTIVFTVLSTYFFTKEFTVSISNNIRTLASKNSNQIIIILQHIRKTLSRYILSYLFLIFLTALITLLGFLLFQIDYAFSLSILAGIFDILPILGIACIYAPLVIYYLIKGNVFAAVGLLLLYILNSLLRQFIEPKLLSSSLGIKPLYTLIAIFIGLQLWGVIGIIFCIFLIILYKVLYQLGIL